LHIDALPTHLKEMRYDGRCYPGSDFQVDGHGNCQAFAYAVLRHFGRVLLDFRSSELWSDTRFTFAVSEFVPLDIVLFNASENAFGAHVGLYAGNERVVHLSKQAGIPTSWTLDEFARNPRYRVRIGTKRTRE
jgi:hypothetical protein